MKKLLALFFLLFSTSAFATDIALPISTVVDGDTIRTFIKLPCPLCAVSVRILGIDTPEATRGNAKCELERQRGLQAKAFLTEYLKGKQTMIVRTPRWDKYGGRILGYVEVDGVNVGELLVQKGFAKPYDGVGPRPDWCV